MTLRRLDRPTSPATLYRRAVLGSIVRPALGRIPLLGGAVGRPSELSGDGFELAGIEIDRDHVAAYDRVCGFDVTDELPATYLHNVAFSLAMELMTADDFPFSVIGMVHVANRIEQRRPLTADDRPTVRLHAENLRPHRAGRQLDVVGEATVDGELVWRDVSTYLRTEASTAERPARPRGGGRGTPPAPQPEAVWSLPGDLGRRFAAVSGDRNPIHMSALSAKAFGMPAAIAHGMWLKARCLAALSRDERVRGGSFAIEVSFKRPVVLPAKVGFASSEIAGDRIFTLHDVRRRTPHLEGALTAL